MENPTKNVNDFDKIQEKSDKRVIIYETPLIGSIQSQWNNDVKLKFYSDDTFVI